MPEHDNNTALSSHASIAYEKRNAAFRVLYDTVLQIEGADETGIYNVLCTNLGRITNASRVAMAAIDYEGKKIKLKAYSSQDCNLLSWSQVNGPCAELEPEIVDALTNKLIMQTDNFADFFHKYITDIDSCVQKGKCYRFSCIRDEQLIAVGFVELEPDERIQLKDLIGTYMNLAGTILQRVNAEKKVKDSQDYLKTILELIDSGMMVIDPDSHKILDVNNYAANLFKCSKADIIGTKCFDLFCPDKKDNCPMEKGDIQNIASEHEFIRKDGQQRTIIKNVKPVTRNGRRYYLETFVDITEIKNAQRARTKLMKEIEEANSELNNFAHIVSHDLKAPLRGIISLSSWLQESYHDKLDADGKEFLDLLQGRTTKMVELIDGILRYSRVGKTNEELTEVVLDEVVPELVDLLNPPENIKVVIENPMPVIMADSTRISQLFQNLISNAVKYIDKPDGLIKISCIEKPDCWQFGVTDNGPGIDEKYHGIVFDIFKTLGQNKKKDSTGVGLSIVKKIVDTYGGKIWIESKPNEGTSFLFELPKTMAAKTAKVPAAIC